MGQIPQDGENGQNVASIYFLFLALLWLTFWFFFQLFSAVLKRFWPSPSSPTSSTSNSSSSGSRWARTKTRTFLECPGQSLQNSREKLKKSNRLVTAESQKKCHILTVFPVLRKLTHIGFPKWLIIFQGGIPSHVRNQTCHSKAMMNGSFDRAWH